MKFRIRTLADRARRKLLRREASAGGGVNIQSNSAPYNWVDLAMLGVSALTPVMLFVLGYMISEASSAESLRHQASVRQETIAREDAAARKAERRDAQRATEAIRRAGHDREEARRDAQAARAEARRDAQFARDDAFARELRLQAHANKTADQVRQQASLERQAVELLERRARAWAVIAPLVSELDIEARAFGDAPTEEARDRRRKSIIEIRDKVYFNFSAYYVYFGRAFKDVLWSYLNGCLGFVEMRYKSDNEEDEAYEEFVGSRFDRLYNAAATMLKDPMYSPPVYLEGPAPLDDLLPTTEPPE